MKITSLIVIIIFSQIIFGKETIPYDDLIQIYDEILTANLEQVQKVEVAKSASGESVWGYLISNKKRAPKQLIFVSAAIHGNEYLNIEHKLFASFVSLENSSFQEFYARGGAILFIPIYNIDGYRKHQRKNSNDIDLNRDFLTHTVPQTGMSQPETIGVTSWIANYVTESGAALSFTMEYHCCQPQSTLLYPWAYKYGAISDTFKVKYGKYFNLLKESGIANLLLIQVWQIYRAFVDGSSFDYWADTYKGSINFGFEGSEKGEEQNIKAHIAWWNGVVSTL